MAATGTAIARQLRRDQTEAEKRLWSCLRSRQFGGVKFRRQVPVGRFVADFVCHEARLIVELDGGQHADREESDAQRTAVLENAVFHVLRFWNNEVLSHPDGVLQRIKEVLALSGERDFEV